MVFTVGIIGITIYFWQWLCSICHNYGSIGSSLQSLKLVCHRKFDPNIPRDSLDSQYLNDLTCFFRLKGCSCFPHFRGKKQNLDQISLDTFYLQSKCLSLRPHILSRIGVIIFFTHPLHQPSFPRSRKDILHWIYLLLKVSDKQQSNSLLNKCFVSKTNLHWNDVQDSCYSTPAVIFIYISHCFPI